MTSAWKKTKRLILSAAGTAGLGLAEPGHAQSGSLPPVPSIEAQGQRLAHLILSGGAVSLGQPQIIAKDWSRVSYSVVAPVDDADALVQINLGGATGEIVVRNFRLTEESDSEKATTREPSMGPLWNKDWQTVISEKAKADFRAVEDGLAISVSKRTDFPWDVQLALPHVSLKRGTRYTISFEARASVPAWPLTSYLMRAEPLRFYAGIDERNPFLETARLATPAGVDILSVLIPSLPWTQGPEDAQMAFIQDGIARVVETAPQAKLILRFSIEPPGWWRREHPADLLTWESGRTGRYVCVASPALLAEVRERLSRFIKAIEQRWGDRVIGYAPAAQSTGEWYYPIWDSRDGEAMNFSRPFRSAYQAFLKGKYGDVKSLNEAWHATLRSFDEIAVPSGAKRLEARLGIFRDPSTQRELFDFTEFQQLAISGAIENVAATIKSATENRKLVLPF